MDKLDYRENIYFMVTDRQTDGQNEAGQDGGDEVRRERLHVYLFTTLVPHTSDEGRKGCRGGKE